MKITIKPENETIQVNSSSPFNEWESSVNACPRIGELLSIEGKGPHRIVDIIHDLSIEGEDYSIGETVIIAEKEE